MSRDTPLSICVALVIIECLGKQQELQDEALQKPRRFLSPVVVIQVSLLVSVLETWGYSVVQCLWTEKLEKGHVVYEK